MIIHVPSQKDWAQKLQTIVLKTGITMAYQEMGNTEKPVMIMLHGFSDSSRAMRMIASHLENDFHMYALDLRGHGHSDKPEQYAYTPCQYSEDVKAFADQLNIAGFTVLGASMGSMTAQAVAYSMPDRVDHTVLLATGARFLHSPEDVREILSNFAEYDHRTPPLEELIPTWERFDDKGYLEEFYKEAVKWPVRCWLAAWRGMEITDNRKLLQYIQSPVICMWGSEDDCFAQDAQEEVKGLLPGAEVVILDGASHEIQQEKHAEIAGHIKRWFEIK